MNRDLVAILRRMRTSLFASAFYLVADVGTGQMHYANAGHPSPLHVRRDANVVQPLVFGDDQCGPALGVFEEMEYPTCSCELAVHDLIVLFTDGLFEVAGRDDDFDMDRLLAAVQRRVKQPAARLFDEVLAEIQQFSTSGEFEDDVCLVGMEVARVGPAEGTNEAA